MKPTICICCGEPISQRGNALSRNPNICASCSSMADGLDESSPEFQESFFEGQEQEHGLAEKQAVVSQVKTAFQTRV